MCSSQIRFRGWTQDNADGGNSRLSQEEAATSFKLYERHFEDILTEDERDYYQPAVWWFASVIFPLFASAFGPIACLFSIGALVQPWLTSATAVAGVANPGWLLALQIVSLVLALLANLLLLFNFAKRITYAIAQPLTIIFWYLSFIFLLVPVVITHTTLLHRQSSYSLSQSYYYAFIATIIYFVISTLLLFNLLGSSLFHAYPPSLAQLDRPQRTIMLQTIIFSAYLALGATIYSSIENWDFLDGLYWTDYTLLTIGFGSDFPVRHTVGRMVLIPFVAVGFLIVGMIVGSLRALVVERARNRISKRRLQLERKKWFHVIEKWRNGTEEEAKEAEKKFMRAKNKWLKRKKISALDVEGDDGEMKRWRFREFMLMRHIEEHAGKVEGYITLAFSFLIFAIVWAGGAIVFWACQLSDPTSWTYTESLYFTYTSILTIGYGDFYPSTTSAKPFCVIWSFLAIPSVTVFIHNVGQTIAGEVQSGVEWVGRWSVLPEKQSEAEGEIEDVGGVQDTRDRKRSIAMLPIRWHRHGRKHKGKGRATVEEAGTGGTSSGPQRQRPPLQTPPLPAIISGTGQPSFGIPSLLSVRLSRGIARVSRDAATDPMTRYTWHEWVQWLRLMDEAGEMLGICGSDPRDTDPVSGVGHTSSREIFINNWQQQRWNQQDSDSTLGRARLRVLPTTTTLVDRWRWGWLDDNGPLFSSMTEAQWILERFCRLFEGVVEKELEGWWKGGNDGEGEC